VKLPNDSTEILFLNPKDYEKLQKHELQDLDQKNKNVKLKAQVKMHYLDDFVIYEAMGALSVKVKKGKSQWKK
jgi:hypothetical protein